MSESEKSLNSQNPGPRTILSKRLTSVTFDVKMTELLSLLETITPSEFLIPGSYTTLSLAASSIGQTLCIQLDSLDPTIRISLHKTWTHSPEVEKSGEGPTS